MLEVIELYPRILDWFINLCWVRFITCRPQRAEEPELETEQIQPEVFAISDASRDSEFGSHKSTRTIPLAVSWPSNGRGTNRRLSSDV